jgi:hypothetical protein
MPSTFRRFFFKTYVHPKEHFVSHLLAYLDPGTVVLNVYFNAHLPILPAKMYFVDSHSDGIMDVTSRVRPSEKAGGAGAQLH